MTSHRSARRELLIDCAIAAVYLALVAIWSLTIPFNAAPDEISHMFLVEYLTRFKSLPTPQIDPVLPFIGSLTAFELQNTVNWYHGLPFAHTLGATISSNILLPFLPRGSGYLGARAFNWMLGAIFLFVLIQALSWSGVQRMLARLIALLIATIPQVTFVFAYFNHDAFGVAAIALGLHAFLRITKRTEFVTADSIYLGAACGLILLAKPYHYPALVFFLLMLILMRWIKPTFRVGATLIRSVIAAALVSGPMLTWTYIRYGELTGVSMVEHFLSKYPPPPVPCFFFCSDTLVNWRIIGPWAWRSFQSFFGVFDWMSLDLPEFAYVVWFLPLAVLFGVLSMLLVVRRVKDYKLSHDRQALFDAGFVTLTILMLVETAGMSVSASQLLAPQPQGRYLFVVLPFVAYCIAIFALGIQSTLTYVRRGANVTPHRSRQGTVFAPLAALTVCMFLLNIYAALFVLAPAYKNPGGHNALDPFGNQLRLDFSALSKALSVSSSGLVITVPTETQNVVGVVDRVLLRPGGRVTISGWAFDREKDGPAEVVVVAYKGVPIHVAKVGTPRRDAVSKTGRPAALQSGFAIIFPRGDLDPCSTQVYAVTSSLKAHELARGKNACPN